MSEQPQTPDGSETTSSSSAITGSFGLQLPRWITTELAPHAELLRLLGRLEVMTTRQIRSMVYPRVPRSTFYGYLQRLVDEELIYRTKARFGMLYRSGATAPPLKHPYIYGLTPAGRDFLDSAQAEVDEGTLSQLKVRDPRVKRLSASNLAHDLQVSWWCSALIEELRRNRFCTRLLVQVEFVAHETQRIDALVIARFSTKFPREAGGGIPWFDGTTRLADEGEIRLALEVDRGTEPLRVLMEKGRAYRNLTADGVYTRRLGGAVIPVFLVPTARRARQIAAEWRHVWPEGWGVISTPPAADHPQHGTLWGRYLTLSNLRQTLPLMTEVAGGQLDKPEFRTLFTLEQWQRGIPAPDAREQPESRGPGA
jgi:hypothetical protein